MQEWMENIIVGAIILAISAMTVRSLYLTLKNHRTDTVSLGCSGKCASCALCDNRSHPAAADINRGIRKLSLSRSVPVGNETGRNVTNP